MSVTKATVAVSVTEAVAALAFVSRVAAVFEAAAVAQGACQPAVSAALQTSSSPVLLVGPLAAAALDNADTFAAAEPLATDAGVGTASTRSRTARWSSALLNHEGPTG